MVKKPNKCFVDSSSDLSILLYSLILSYDSTLMSDAHSKSPMMQSTMLLDRSRTWRLVLVTGRKLMSWVRSNRCLAGIYLSLQWHSSRIINLKKSLSFPSLLHCKPDFFVKVPVINAILEHLAYKFLVNWEFVILKFVVWVNILKLLGHIPIFINW